MASEKAKARKEAKLQKELEEAEKRANGSNPAESLSADGQKTDNKPQAKENEPVKGTTFEPGTVVATTPLNAVTGTVATIVKTANPITAAKNAAKAAKKGKTANAVLEATGLPGVVRGVKKSAVDVVKGQKVDTKHSKVYNKTYEEEKAEQREEELKKLEASPKVGRKEELKKLEASPKVGRKEVVPATKTPSAVSTETETEEPIKSREAIDEAIKNSYGSAYADYMKKMPTFMRQAYKNGQFGEPGSKDAKTRYAYFMTNGIGTALANLAGNIGNAAMSNAGKSGTYQAQDSDWQKVQKENLQNLINTQWAGEQKKQDISLNQLSDILGADVKIYNDMKEQDAFIKKARQLGKKHGQLTPEEEAQYIAGMLFLQARQTGNHKAMIAGSLAAMGSNKKNRQTLKEKASKIANLIGFDFGSMSD